MYPHAPLRSTPLWALHPGGVRLGPGRPFELPGVGAVTGRSCGAAARVRTLAAHGLGLLKLRSCQRGVSFLLQQIERAPQRKASCPGGQLPTLAYGSTHSPLNSTSLAALPANTLEVLRLGANVDPSRRRLRLICGRQLATLLIRVCRGEGSTPAARYALRGGDMSPQFSTRRSRSSNAAAPSTSTPSSASTGRPAGPLAALDDAGRLPRAAGRERRRPRCA